MGENKNNCLICKKELMYLNQSKKMKCYYCGKEYESNASCEAGHYVCDICHSKGAYEIIHDYCMKSMSIDPLKIAVELMKHPSIKMHGPEHHFLVPAVLITAYVNKCDVKNKKEMFLNEAVKRSRNVLGGFCGFYGACGAAIGTGIAVSIISQATPLSKEEWGECNMMTSRALESIASYGGPRCCKRDSFTAIEVAIDFFKNKFNVELEKNAELKCIFSSNNKECLKNRCKYN